MTPADTTTAVVPPHRPRTLGPLAGGEHAIRGEGTIRGEATFRFGEVPLRLSEIVPTGETRVGLRAFGERRFGPHAFGETPQSVAPPRGTTSPVGEYNTLGEVHVSIESGGEARPADRVAVGDVTHPSERGGARTSQFIVTGNEE